MSELSANHRLRLAHALREADHRYADGVRLARLAAGSLRAVCHTITYGEG